MPHIKFAQYHQNVIYDVLARYDGQITQKKISSLTWIGKNTVSKVMRRLERRGFIKRDGQGKYTINPLSSL